MKYLLCVRHKVWPAIKEVDYIMQIEGKVGSNWGEGKELMFIEHLLCSEHYTNIAV